MKNEIKKWFNENKTKVAVGTVVALGTVGSAVLYYKFGIKPNEIAKDKYKVIADTATENIKKIVEPEPIPVNLGLGTLTDVWKEAGNTNLIVNDITVADLGKLGEAMENIITDTKATTQVSAVIGLFNPVETEVVVEAIEESL